jgi:hypothetical protein
MSERQEAQIIIEKSKRGIPLTHEELEIIKRELARVRIQNERDYEESPYLRGIFD